MVNEELLKAAYHLVCLLDKQADNLLPQEIVDVVKLHGKLAVGSALIPVPGADVAAGAANIWAMYIRINGKTGLEFKENVMKTIGSGVATNLVGYVAMSGVASAMKFIPGIGSVGGALIMSASLYAVTLASGYVYLKALCALAERKGANISGEDLKSAIDELLAKKDVIKDFINQAKKEYKSQ
ncbi:MAG: hypothetical protein IJ615_07915 [Bacteroidaceae bacterium]|nr:hypothetical protein [Bacteroidaceae bacterium]